MATALHEWRIMVISRWAQESKCNHREAISMLDRANHGAPPIPFHCKHFSAPPNLLVWVLVVSRAEPFYAATPRMSTPPTTGGVDIFDASTFLTGLRSISLRNLSLR